MKISDGQIGTRELVSIIIILIGSKFSDITPNLLIPIGKTSTWLIPFIAAAVISGPFLLILHVLKQFENKNLIEVIYILTGKYIGFVISFLLFVIILAATVLNSRGYVETIASLFYPETPHSIIYLIILLGSYFIANRGLEAIGRTVWICIPYIKLSLLIYLILIWREVNMSFIFPILGPGTKDLLINSTKYSTIFAELFLVTILYPFVRKKKNFHNASYIGIGIAIMELAIFFALYLMVFDYPAIEKLGYPFHHIARMLHIGQFISNLEGVFLAFWVVSAVIRYGILIYLTVMFFSYMLKIKEFEPLLLPFTVLIFLLGLIPENVITAIFVLRSDYLLQGGWPVFIFLPIALWLLTYRRKGNVS